MKMISFGAFQIAHQVAMVQNLTLSRILVEGSDGKIIFLHYSTRPLFGTLSEITAKGEENNVALAWLQLNKACSIVFSWISQTDIILLLLLIFHLQRTLTVISLLLYFSPNIRTFGGSLTFQFNEAFPRLDWLTTLFNKSFVSRFFEMWPSFVWSQIFLSSQPAKGYRF